MNKILCDDKEQCCSQRAANPARQEVRAVSYAMESCALSVTLEVTCHQSMLQDVAKMTLAALRSDATVGQTLTLAGPKAWTVPEVIELCEKLADERAQVTQVSC